MVFKVERLSNLTTFINLYRDYLYSLESKKAIIEISEAGINSSNKIKENHQFNQIFLVSNLKMPVY